MAKFINLGNAMINIESIEGIWKRDMAGAGALTPSKPYFISITFRNKDKTEDLKFETKAARDGMYNVITGKMKGEIL